MQGKFTERIADNIRCLLSVQGKNANNLKTALNAAGYGFSANGINRILSGELMLTPKQIECIAEYLKTDKKTLVGV